MERLLAALRQRTLRQSLDFLNANFKLRHYRKSGCVDNPGGSKTSTAEKLLWSISRHLSFALVAGMSSPRFGSVCAAQRLAVKTQIAKKYFIVISRLR